MQDGLVNQFSDERPGEGVGRRQTYQLLVVRRLGALLLLRLRRVLAVLELLHLHGLLMLQLGLLPRGALRAHPALPVLAVPAPDALYVHRLRLHRRACVHPAATPHPQTSLSQAAVTKRQSGSTDSSRKDG